MRRSTLIVVLALVALSAPAPALASHDAESELYRPILCLGKDREAYGRGLYTTGKCDGVGDLTITITQPAERGLAVVEDGVVKYVPLRPGPDSFTFVGSDGHTQSEATVTSTNMSSVSGGGGLVLPLDSWKGRPNRHGVLSLPSVGCPYYPTAPACYVQATAKTKIRQRGRWRTITLGRGSHWLTPDPNGDYPRLGVKLTRAARALLKRRGRMKANVFLSNSQLDPRGYWREKQKLPVTLLKPRAR